MLNKPFGFEVGIHEITWRLCILEFLDLDWTGNNIYLSDARTVLDKDKLLFWLYI